MGQKIQNAFELILNEFGLAERMRVSMIAAIPSASAQDVPDDPANIARVKDAVSKVCAENTAQMNKILSALS